MPVGPHLEHCLAQYGAHFHVDSLFNLGIIWGVIIMRFHDKFCCFCTLYRARYVKNKLELHLHYGDKQSQFKMVRWPEASGLLAGWLAAASCCLACCWLAGWLSGCWRAAGWPRGLLLPTAAAGILRRPVQSGTSPTYLWNWSDFELKNPLQKQMSSTWICNISSWLRN